MESNKFFLQKTFIKDPRTKESKYQEKPVTAQLLLVVAANKACKKQERLI